MSTETTTPVAAPVEPAVKRKNWFRRHWLWTTIFTVLAFIILASELDGGDATTTAAEPAPVPTVTVTATVTQDPSAAKEQELASKEADLAAREEAVKAAEVRVATGTIPGDGTFVVGSQVQPGRYQAPSSGGRCYWARLDGNGEIRDNNIGSGPALMTVRAGDAAVETHGCGTFTKVA